MKFKKTRMMNVSCDWTSLQRATDEQRRKFEEQGKRAYEDDGTTEWVDVDRLEDQFLVEASPGMTKMMVMGCWGYLAQKGWVAHVEEDQGKVVFRAPEDALPVLAKNSKLNGKLLLKQVMLFYPEVYRYVREKVMISDSEEKCGSGIITMEELNTKSENGAITRLIGRSVSTSSSRVSNSNTNTNRKKRRVNKQTSSSESSSDDYNDEDDHDEIIVVKKRKKKLVVVPRNKVKEEEEDWDSLLSKFGYQFLLSKGWTAAKGSGLIDWFYLVPGNTMGKQKYPNGVQGKDFLTARTEMPRYIRETDNLMDEFKSFWAANEWKMQL